MFCNEIVLIESCLGDSMLVERLRHGKFAHSYIQVKDLDLISRDRRFYPSTCTKPLERNITSSFWQVLARYVILNCWWAVVIGPCTGKGLTSASGRQGMIAWQSEILFSGAPTTLSSRPPSHSLHSTWTTSTGHLRYSLPFGVLGTR